jgi:ectoine hydroxylase-related dioxygenase (phytanoyl-CoA dioxygenase family)
MAAVPVTEDGARALRRQLVTTGICTLPPVFRPDELSEINRGVDEAFAARRDEDRAYVRIDEMWELALLPLIFNAQMIDLIFASVDSPVLYHCHMYEIAGRSNAPHIFGETLSGFHTDRDSEWNPRQPTHVSIFVYLSQVDANSSPFEFVIGPPTQWLSRQTPVAEMLGAPGTTFLWNRSFYHRAAPNRSEVRRRLLKLSIQPKDAYNPLLGDEPFETVRSAVGEGAEPRLAHLLGLDVREPIPTPVNVQAQVAAPTRSLDLGLAALAKANLKAQARYLKREMLGGPPARVVTYD